MVEHGGASGGADEMMGHGMRRCRSSMVAHGRQEKLSLQVSTLFPFILLEGDKQIEGSCWLAASLCES